MIYIYSHNIEDIVYIDNHLDVVVLSPSFCWFEILELPTSSLSKAKKIADHTMSDRPENYTDISMVKKEGKFYTYAYDGKAIEAILKKINKKNVKIYFAYELLLDTPIIITRTNRSLTLIPFENTIVECTQCVDESITLTLGEYFIKHNLKSIKSVLSLNPNSSKSIALMNSINIVFFLTVLIYGFNQYSTLEQIKEYTNNMNTYDKSIYEIKSLIKTYSNYEKKSSNLKSQLKNSIKNQRELTSIIYKSEKLTTSKDNK